jgi:hypothetical protein
MYKCESISRYILNDINSVVFHFDDFNHNHIFFNNCNSAGFFFINYYIILNTCFIDVLQKLPSSQITAEISKHQRYRSILHV